MEEEEEEEEEDGIDSDGRSDDDASRIVEVTGVGENVVSASRVVGPVMSPIEVELIFVILSLLLPLLLLIDNAVDIKSLLDRLRMLNVLVRVG